MLRAPIFAILTALALPLAISAGSLGAQPFGEEISITEVQIPVHVLSHGAPVRGLTRDDFEVLDGGQERPITAFQVIDLGGGSRSSHGEADSSRGASPAAPAEDSFEGRKILLLFDFLFAQNHDLKRGVLGARELVARQLHPADRVGVAYLAGGGGSILLGFTSDRADLEHALGAVEALLDRRSDEMREHLVALAASREAKKRGGRRLPAASLGDLSAQVGAAGAIALAGGGVVPPDLAFIASAQADFELARDLDSQGTAPSSADGPNASLGRLYPDSPFALGASLAGGIEGSAIRTMTVEIGRLVTLLRGVTGQKHLVLLSEGFSSEVLNDHSSPERPVVLRNLETLFEALRRSGWTLHAIDVSGLESPNENREIWGAGRTAAIRGGSSSGRGFDADALFFMATETGGQLFENHNRIAEATAELIERTSVTYLLTINPGTLPADGRYHPLEVRLRGDRPEHPGTELLHRPGYYAPKARGEKTPLEAHLDSIDVLLGDAETDPLGIRVLAAAVAGESDTGQILVPFAIDVPGDAIVAGRSSGSVSLDLQVYAVDSRGGVQDLWQRRVSFDLAKVAVVLDGGGARLRGTLAVPPDDYRLRVLVTPQGGKGAALTTTPVAAQTPAAGLPTALRTRAPRPWLDLS